MIKRIHSTSSTMTKLGKIICLFLKVLLLFMLILCDVLDHPKIPMVNAQRQLKTVMYTVQSAQPYYVSFSLANEERINFLASSALFPRSFHALSTIISRLSHATNPTTTRNVKFACHSIVPRSPRATGKIASRYTLQPIATCLHFILDQYRILSSDPNVFTRVR